MTDSGLLTYLTSYKATNKAHAKKLILIHDNRLLKRTQKGA